MEKLNTPKRQSFLIKVKLYDAVKLLTDEEAGKLFKAIFYYEKNGKVPKLERGLSALLVTIGQDLDNDKKRYNAIVARNRKNIKKRWDKEKATTGKSGIPKLTKHTNNNNNNNNNNNKRHTEAKQILQYYNKIMKTNFKSLNFTKNYTLSRQSYSVSEIKQAIINLSSGKWWANRPTPQLIFRQRGSTGDVDYIGELLNLKVPKEETDINKIKYLR